MVPHVETWKNNVHPDDQERVMAAMGAHLSGRFGRYDAEYRLRNRNGDFLWVHDRGRICDRDENDQPTRVVGMVIDVTERKLAEQKAQRLSAYQALIFRLSSAFVKLPLDRIDAAIQAALGEIGHFFGVDRGYVLQYDAPSRGVSNSHVWAAPGVAADIAANQALSCAVVPEWFARHERGEPIVIENVVRLPAHDPLKAVLAAQGICSLLALPLMCHGVCIGCVGFDAVRSPCDFGEEEMSLLGLFAGLLSNVAERRLAEETLRQERETLQLILDCAPIGIWLQDGKGKIAIANKALCQSIGLSEAQILAAPHYADLLPAVFSDACKASDARALSSHKPIHAQEQLPFVDGKVHDLHVIKSVSRDEAGKPLALVGLSLDVTESKQAEAELARYRDHLEALVEERTQALLVAKDAAEAASRAKSTFLANMSHELRTPMNAIIGLTAMAQRRASDPQQLEQLGKVAHASRHLLEVINDVLDISKIEAERLTLENLDFKLADVFVGLRDLVGHRLAEKGLDFQIVLPEALGDQYLQGDPLRLGQILLNLVGNAIKFTQQGYVKVAVRLQAETVDKLSLWVEVEDSGIGIAEETQQRLFAAFEQADNSMTRRYGGSGLGLAICKRLMHLMAGEIGVQSVEGQGSLFWFALTLRKGVPTAASVPARPGESVESQLLSRHTGVSVLLVEDEPINREIALDLLEGAGLVVDLAEDGQAGLALAQKNRYALIFMDIQMPKMNGLEATQAIRAHSKNQATPILAMTANAFKEDRLRCLGAGMDDFLGKPIEPEVLFAMTLAWLDKGVSLPV
jgi:PAS domain S-box-containing protein